ncbi:MAG: Spy/CpxP family protein refolding chaperone [Desulfuromonadaceae bacterium]|nr:Spy/CpxP family protein refolding chaperone [Desulfuromonadaceae bacterium]
MSMTAVMIAGIAAVALADGSPVATSNGTDVSASAAQQHGAKFKQIREKKMAERAAALGLTEAQQSQIKAITAAARQVNAPLRQKLAADRKQIKALSSAAPFDESAVRSLIAGDESVRTDLAVSRIKARNQIQAVLTPEQQAKAKELRQLAPNRHHKLGNSGL